MPYFRSIVLTSIFVLSVPAGAAFAQYDSSAMMPGMSMKGSAASSSSATAPMGLFSRKLAVGAKGADVMRLQEILAEHGLFTVQPTGYFGPVTSKGVAALQKIYNLEQVGFVGPQTRGLLNSLDARLTESAKNAVLPSDVGSSSGSSSAPQAGGIFSRILNIIGQASNDLLAAAGASTAPFTLSFSSSATSIQPGHGVTLTWTSNTDGCTATGGWDGPRDASGSMTVIPTTSDTFTLTCWKHNTTETVSKSIAIAVLASAPPPTVTLSSSATSAVPGSPITLTWSSTNASSCSLTGGSLSGTLATSGSRTTTISSTQTYSLSCTGAGGSASQSATVAILAPTVSFSSNHATVAAGNSVTLTWSSVGATACAAHNNWTGTLATSGSRTIDNLTANQLYTIACTNAAGTTYKNISVSVTQPTTTPTPTPTPISPVVTSEGDSISVFWSGNHTGIYAANNPSVTVRGLAVGGSSIQTLEGRVQPVLDTKPKVFTVLIGGNDLGGYGGTAAGWHTELLKYINTVRPSGARILVGTLLPQCNMTTFNGLRDQANALIRADVGIYIDGVVDFAADPAFDQASDGCNTTNFSDYVHPSATGQQIMAGIYTKAVNAALSGQTVQQTAPAPTLTLTSKITTITPGGSATLSWSSTGATSCTASGSWSGTKATTGTYTFANITSSQTYTLSCSGPGGTTSKSVSVFVTSNALGGLDPISSNFDTSIGLTPDVIPASGVPDVVGAFRFICGAGQLSYDDPIVYPGQPGKSHLHQYYGNLGANAYSTYASLRQTGGSTCNAFGDETKADNRSAYWMPAMLDGKSNAVEPDYVVIYYKRRPASDPVVSDPTNPRYEGQAVPLPNGLRFIFGYDFLTNKAPTGSQWFDCAGPTATPGHYNSIAEAAANCPVNPPGTVQNQIGWRIEAPQCWDGKNLDSANHRDHVAYATYGSWGYQKCDAAHPYVIPGFTLGAWWTIDSNLPTWHFSSDEMVPGIAAGTTGHADFFMAWDPIVRDMWEGGCINQLLNCSSGNMGNGFRLIGAIQPRYWVNGVLTGMWTNPNRLVPVPARP